MEIIYKLFRHSGYLFFNSFSDKERYWVSVQAASHGGGAMYADITEKEFNNVFHELCDVTEFSSRFNRYWEPDVERRVAEKYNIREAIEVHNLKQYAAKPDKDGVCKLSNEPIKSIITANKTQQ